MAFNATNATFPQAQAAQHRHALKTGIYSVRDFVRGGEETIYADTLINLMTQLAPAGVLEECFATEIMKSTWRLRRCRNIEQDLAGLAETDPLIDEKTQHRQNTVDRCRAHSHALLHRSIAELTKLQTARTLRLQLGAEHECPGLADPKQLPGVLKRKQGNASQPAPGLPDMDALMALADRQLAERYRESGLSSFCNPGIPPTPAPVPNQTAPQTPDSGLSSFCKSAETAAPTINPGQAVSTKVPRNAACPCGSGVKFKRCCGNPAAPRANSASGRAA